MHDIHFYIKVWHNDIKFVQRLFKHLCFNGTAWPAIVFIRNFHLPKWMLYLNTILLVHNSWVLYFIFLVIPLLLFDA